MKTLLNLCCAASLGCVFAIWVGGTGSSTSNLAQASATASDVSRPVKVSSGFFGSHARSKVVQYFDTYQPDPRGLRTGIVSRARMGPVTSDWTTDDISAGTIVTENMRSSLVEAPEELVRVLPSDEGDVRYYLAGNHLVALDAGYKVLDTVRIPTVRIAGEDPIAKGPSIQMVRQIQRGRTSR